MFKTSLKFQRFQKYFLKRIKKIFLPFSFKKSTNATAGRIVQPFFNGVFIFYFFYILILQLNYVPLQGVILILKNRIVLKLKQKKVTE